MYHGAKSAPKDSFLRRTPLEHQNTRLILETLVTRIEYNMNFYFIQTMPKKHSKYKIKV